MTNRSFIIPLIVALIVATCVALGLTMIQSSNVYTVEAMCHATPHSDDELLQWLTRHPGVVKRTVHLERVSERKLRLTLVIVQNLLKYPPFPDIEIKCEEFGYDLDGKFVDLHPRGS